MHIRAIIRGCLWVAGTAVIAIGLLPAMPVHAALLTSRSITLGSPVSGATTTHKFSFTYASGGTVGSVLFQYCDSPLAAVPCVAPPGLDVSAAGLQQQQGQTGFSIVNQTANTITLGRTPTASGNSPSSYTFNNTVNMSGAPGTFYARITTFISNNATGGSTDFGAVVTSTTQGISISTEVPPILNFCVAQAIPGDCSTATGDVVDLGVMRSSAASVGTSQLRAATNAPFGLVIVANGTTLTSGNNIIPSPASPTPSAPGNGQFGINLRANSSPPVGQDSVGPGVAHPTSRYNIPNRFAFIPGDTIATTPATTDVRLFTVSYIANVAPGQPAGVYTATFTYICTATF